MIWLVEKKISAVGWRGYWGSSWDNDRFLFKIPVIWKVQLLDTTESKQTSWWEHNNLKLFSDTFDHRFVSYIFCN